MVWDGMGRDGMTNGRDRGDADVCVGGEGVCVCRRWGFVLCHNENLSSSLRLQLDT